MEEEIKELKERIATIEHKYYLLERIVMEMKDTYLKDLLKIFIKR